VEILTHDNTYLREKGNLQKGTTAGHQAREGGEGARICNDSPGQS